MIREKAKLSLLVGCLLVCLISVLTSQKSFQMGPRDLPILKPQTDRFCKSIWKARNQCRKKQQEEECPKIIREASKCEAAVLKAYRNINMGGCPYELRDVTLCELERCGGYHGITALHTSTGTGSSNHGAPPLDAIEGCMQHCRDTRKKLNFCIETNVRRQMQKYGIRIQQG